MCTLAVKIANLRVVLGLLGIPPPVPKQAKMYKVRSRMKKVESIAFPEVSRP